jgi:hypothetical protein
MTIDTQIPELLDEIRGEFDALEAELADALHDRDAALTRGDDLEAQLAALKATPAMPGLGYYLDDGSWPTTPDVSNTYAQPNQPGLGSGGVAREQARVRRGTSPNISLSSNGTQHLSGIVAGTAADVAWLDTYVAALAKIAATDPTVPVYATLDQEDRVRTRKGLITGPDADPATYGRALSLFYAKCRATKQPNLVPTYWIVGSDREFEGAVGAAFTEYPGASVFDPYARNATDTLESICRNDLAWIRSQPWHIGQPIGLGEFAMPVKFGDPALARFYTDVRHQLAVLGIDWAVMFNRPKDNDHQITNRTDGQKFPQAAAAFGASL